MTETSGQAKREVVEMYKDGKLILGNPNKPAPATMGNTREEVLSILESDEKYAFENLKKLKVTVDLILAGPDKESPQLLFALEKLISTTFEEGLLNVETLEKLGFSPAVSDEIVNFGNEICSYNKKATEEEITEAKKKIKEKIQAIRDALLEA